MTSGPRQTSVVLGLVTLILLAAGLVIQQREQGQLAAQIDDLTRQLDLARADLARLERTYQARPNQSASEPDLIAIPAAP